MITNLVLAMALASSAYAQIDSYGLRAKFGMPLNRETFEVKPGVRIVVDYGSGAQVCRIELSPFAMNGGSGATTEQLHAVLAEAVPPSVRGKSLGREWSQISGLSSVSSVEYENVVISEPHVYGEQNTSVTVTFKSAECRAQPAH